MKKLIHPDSQQAKTLGGWAQQLFAEKPINAERAKIMRLIAEYVAEGYGVPLVELANSRRTNRATSASAAVPG